MVLPTVSWLAEEYDALGVPFRSRGDLLDEHLQAWATLWRDTPAAHTGRHYSFRDVYFEPKAFRPRGPPLWIGGSGLHRRMTERIVRYGAGFNPLGCPGSSGDEPTRCGPRAAGRDPGTLELIGGTRATFRDRHSVADLGRALATTARRSRPGSARSASSRPSSPATPPPWAWCREIMHRVDGLLPDPGLLP